MPGHTVKQVYYKEVLKFPRKQEDDYQKWKNESWILHQDSASQLPLGQNVSHETQYCSVTYHIWHCVIFFHKFFSVSQSEICFERNPVKVSRSSEDKSDMTPEHCFRKLSIAFFRTVENSYEAA